MADGGINKWTRRGNQGVSTRCSLSMFRGPGRPNPSRETNFQARTGTTSRIGNLTRLIHTLLHVMVIHTYIHIRIIDTPFGGSIRVACDDFNTGAVGVLLRHANSGINSCLQ